MLTQKEAAAALGVSQRQFARYRHRFGVRAEGWKALVPLFSPGAIARLRQEVDRSKAESIERCAAARRGRKKGGQGVVSLAEMKAAKRRAR